MSKRLSIEVLGDGRVAQLPERGRLVLGADPDRADLLLTGQGVAAVHCTIGRLKGGGWALRDLGSEFGTLWNGERVETARLADGDQLVLGSKRLRVFDPHAAAAATPPPPREERPGKERPARGEKDKPRAAAVPAAAAPSGPAGASDAPPRLRGYTLERRLGRGAMGDVWLARQESLDRQVAIKMLSKKLEADPEFVSRFQAEARAAAALNHPNLVTVHDVGVDDGHHFLTMEFMAAGCLESRLAKLGPIPWREALGILLDAARGLEYAEAKRVVHRDIKPANLMQTEDGITKICDLGLAVQLEQEELEAEGGRVFGTPHFIAPEVVRGQRADSRSDLFSLGATAYRILSGHTAFEGDTTREVLRSVLQDDPEPLDTVVPGLPASVARLVDRLLVKDPDQRMPSASVLVRELEALRSTDGRSAFSDAAPPARRASWVPFAAVGAVLVAALGGWAILSGGDPDPVAPPTVDDGVAQATTASGPGDEQTVEGDPSAEELGSVDAPQTEAEPPTEADDEAAERQAEEAARTAYLELSSVVLDDEQRVARLEGLARLYPGTDTARAIAAEVEALRTARAESLRVAEASRNRLEELEKELRAASLADADPPQPGAALRAVSTVPGFAAHAEDPAAQALRSRILGEVLDRAQAWGAARLAEARTAEEQGRFDDETPLLEAVAALDDLPDDAPPEAIHLRELAAQARDRLATQADRSARFHAARAADDRAAIARGLRDGDGLSLELGALQLERARARAERIGAALATDEARARVAPFADRWRAAEAAVASLVDAWKANQWKRFTVQDPRPGRSNGEVAGATADGLTLDVGGAQQSVPWSAWGGRVDALDNLFLRRIDRDWTPDELTGIAHLLTSQAVVAALRETADAMLEGGSPRFTAGDLGRVLAPFEVARPWAEQAPSALPAWDAERRAAERLGEVLRARSDGLWSVATEHLQRLLSEDQGSLLVLLLSDGSDWRE